MASKYPINNYLYFAHTGLCRQQQKRIEAAIEKAWDHGKSHIDSDTEVE